MTITPHPLCPFHLDASNAGPRSTGIHLSGILRKMALAAGKLPAEYANSNLGDLIRSTDPSDYGRTPQLVRAAFGMAWEDWIVRHVSAWTNGFIHQPGELVRDDIRGNLDGISFNDHGCPIVHEFKFTYKSMNRPIDEEWLWLAQVAGYAALVREYFGQPCTEALLHIAYAMGDYSRGEGSGPRYQPYHIVMEEDEVERAWAEIVKNAGIAEPEVWE
jgi:hypothetical protein